MAYGVYSSLVPVRQRVLRVFSGRDPWNAGRECRWNLTLFKLVQAQAAGAAEWAQIRPKANAKPAKAEADPGPGGRLLKPLDALGLETEGAYRRMLPRALQMAWADGRVDDARLPTVLAGLEPELRKRDFFLTSATPNTRRVLYGIFGIFVAVLLILAALGGIHSERINRNIGREAWLSQSPREETVALQGGGLDVHPLGMLPSGGTPRDPNLTEQPDTRALGWYQAPGAKRLMIYQAGSQISPKDWTQGPVVKVERAGLTPAELVSAGASGRDYDRRYVLIELGGWRHADPYGLGEMRPFLLAMTSIPLIALAIIMVIQRSAIRRETYLLNRILQLASAPRRESTT